MPTALTRTLYGSKKDLTLAKFNVGSLVKAVTFDLEEFGVKGVQGLVVKGSDAQALVTKNVKAKNADDLYCLAGTAKGHLMFVLRHKTDTKFEAGPVTLVKDYDKVRESLAKSTGVARDISPGDREELIVDSTIAHGDRVGGDARRGEGPMDLTGITGDVVLVAHGTPKVLPGRVIGTKLGRKTPDEIVNILIGNSDPKKRLPKDYSGKVTLAGCFTSSGGPGEDAQDDPFAKKVHDLLVSKGYKTVSVVGMPGPSSTGYGGDDYLKDTQGQKPRRGEEIVEHDLEGTEEGVQAIRLKIDELTNKLIELADKAPDKTAFLSSPAAVNVLKHIDSLEKEMTTMSERVKDKKGLSFKGLTGTFGLRQIKAKFKK